MFCFSTGGVLFPEPSDFFCKTLVVFVPLCKQCLFSVYSSYQTSARIVCCSGKGKIIQGIVRNDTKQISILTDFLATYVV